MNNLSLKKNVYLFIGILSIILAKIIMNPSNSIEVCLKISSNFKCESYYFFENLFFGLEPGVVFLLVAFFSLFQVIKINREEKRIEKNDAI